VDVFNILEGKPVMGDTKISGKMMNLTSSSMDIQLNQCRGGVDTGGRMTQQRTVHDLRRIGLAGLAGWYARLAEQRRLVHLAGARGDHNTAEWVLPLDSDADFSTIMVNAVRAPTFDRHLYANSKTAVSGIVAGDTLQLDDLDRMRALIDEQNFPMQSVKFPDDPAAEDEPMFVLLVSTRTWHHLQTSTATQNWRTFLQNARERSSKNPLFTGEPGMWNGILVKKMPRPIRFNAGTAVTVAVDQDTYAETTSVVAGGVTVDRCILVGAQALAEVYGRHTSSGTHFSWHEEKTDHDNTLEASVASITGCSKLGFADKAGRYNDHGVMVMDVSSPAI
jgi:N4-gp56 family major capsid protein